MTNIVLSFIALFAVSYLINRIRGVKDPAKDSLKLTGILGIAVLILGAMILWSINDTRNHINNAIVTPVVHEQ